jgi:hypothetical protein
MRRAGCQTRRVVPLVVILGAGASRGSGDYNDALMPPLTVDLFDERRYGSLLREYDLAHQAGRLIAQERADDSALALEEVLHRLREAEHQHHRQMAQAVPPYLQRLLFEVSREHYADAFRYDALIERLLRLPYVFFVTLNYDVLLDRRLNAHHLLSDFEAYISRDKNWSLLKLHGSINWWHPTTEHYSPLLPPRNLEWITGRYNCAAPNGSLETILGGPATSNTDRYPALALPEGPADRLVLPRAHLDFLQTELRRAQQIDLLVIGYSGLDQEVLKLLAEAEAEIRRMTVVGRDYEDAVRVNMRFEAAGLRAIWPDVSSQNFQQWVGGGHLRRLVEEYDGPYT